VGSILQNVPLVGADGRAGCWGRGRFGQTEIFLIQTARRTPATGPTATVDRSGFCFFFVFFLSALSERFSNRVRHRPDRHRRTTRVLECAASHQPGYGQCGTVRGLARHRHPVLTPRTECPAWLQSRSSKGFRKTRRHSRMAIANPADTAPDKIREKPTIAGIKRSSAQSPRQSEPSESRPI
jgi:hypothetical protein